MEITALSGAKIEKLIKDKNKITFSTLFHDIIANVEVIGITKILKNEESIDTITDTEFNIISVDILPLDFENETFSKATIETDNGDIYILYGEMKGNLLNIEDFIEFLFVDPCEKEEEFHNCNSVEEFIDECNDGIYQIESPECDNLNCCGDCSCEDCKK